ncbi:Hypothetical protein ETEE_3458 [Edwardsiella anguillarum ET080813]|uniref:Uncharacterized protein n=1 Tax=Edwardsiella anguillarum ET080813 TaxID=667120 RepID=A0A076LN02_9GAMM|nr:Hypothetical protein ETEE_3458 [Edwardsiella anguillarum ET080813]
MFLICMRGTNIAPRGRCHAYRTGDSAVEYALLALKNK